MTLNTTLEPETHPGQPDSDQAPVARVYWNGAQTYAGWFNKVSGQWVRLPFKVEQEQAIRMGGGGEHPSTDMRDPTAGLPRTEMPRRPVRK